MDLPPPDPSDDQGYSTCKWTSFSSPHCLCCVDEKFWEKVIILAFGNTFSLFNILYNLKAAAERNYVEDVLQPDLFYGQDLIEEDALKEKTCIEVLRKMIDKADDEIMELEEDLLMLRCELAWDDDNWSKLCSAVLKEKIDHLDILMRSLKKEGTENVSDFSTQLEPPENLPERLHDLLKPLLENYLVNSKQPEAQKPDKKAAESDQNLCPKEEIVIGSSSTENSKVRKDGGPQKNTRESKRQCIKDVENLTLNDLKGIAKNQKLRGYSKLSKKKLRERLERLGHL